MIELNSAPLLVEEFERLPLGDAGTAVLHGEASAAIAVDRDAARAILFPPDVVPASADLLALYSWHTARFAPARHADQKVALHARALGSAPDLARLLRSCESLGDLEDAAASLAVLARPQETYAEAGARAAAAQRSRFERIVAEQLAEAGGELTAPARAYLAALALQTRLDAAQAKHEAHARAVADLADRERQAAAVAAVEAQDAADVARELGEYLASYGLPPDCKVGVFVDQHRARIEVRVRTRRKLLTTRLDAVRVGLRSGPGLFGTKELARGIQDSTLAELQAIERALDAAEGRPTAS